MPVTNFVWDGDQYLMETDESHLTKAVFTNEPDQYTNLISQHRDSATQFAHFDALGSTRQLTDGSETVTDEWNYDAWGNVASRSGTTEFPFQFVGMFGYFYDAANDSFYVVHRIYAPENGRWLSVDPLAFIDGLNMYKYAENMPLIHIDPSGLVGGIGSHWGRETTTRLCCKKSDWKQLEIELNRFYGSPTSWDTIDKHVEVANDIWAACCIRIKVRKRWKISLNLSKKILGKAYPSWEGGKKGWSHVEKYFNVKKRRTRKHKFVEVYYPGFLLQYYSLPPWQGGHETTTIAHGLSYNGAGLLVVGAHAWNSTLAHELGHQLGLTGHTFFGGGLMMPFIFPLRGLLPPECNIARASELLS